VGPELRVRRPGGEDRIDYREVIENFKCARLNALAAGPLERCCSGLDQTKRDAAAREIERESPKRDLTAAKLFLRWALSGVGGRRPRVINVDGHPAYARAIAEMKTVR
jgi:DDE domain